jgi:hypothetical protein
MLIEELELFEGALLVVRETGGRRVAELKRLATSAGTVAGIFV